MNNNMLVNENTSGYTIVNILNNSVLENNLAVGGDGIMIAKAAGSQTTFAVTNSIVRANNLSVHRAGKLILSGNSRLETESSSPSTMADTANPNDFNKGYKQNQAYR
jgi:hypothetical protein